MLVSLRRLASLLALVALPAAAADGKPVLTPPRFTAILQPGFTWGPGEGGKAGEFFLRRFQVGAAGELGTEVLGYAVNLELTKPQKVLRDAYLGVRGFGQELRVGQFKVPFGWEGLVSCARIPTIELSPVEALSIGRDRRDVGLGVFGAVPLAEGWALEDAVAVVNGDGANTADATPRKDAFGRVGVTYGKQLLRLGVSAATVETRKDASPAERSVRVGADAGADLGPVWLLAEYARGEFTAPQRRAAHAFYGTVVGRVGFGVELLARYEQAVAALGSGERQHFVTAGANYVYAPFNARLQVNYRKALEKSGTDLFALQAQYAF